MKANSLKILSAITIALFVLGTTLYAQGTDTRIGSMKRASGDDKRQRSPKQRLKRNIRPREATIRWGTETRMILREL